MAKKKKNFKDVTGIKFADLIMPLVLGGVGSYSQSAGRGVNLGLQAFRTLQAGREYQDEKDLSKNMVENFKNTAQQYEDERNTIQQGITREDPTMTSAEGYYKEEGVIAPDPKWTEESDDFRAERSAPKTFSEQFGERMDPTAGIMQALAAGKEQEGADLINKSLPTGSQMAESPLMAEMQVSQQMIPAVAENFAQGILERKAAGQDSARRLGFIDRQIRFYEQMASLGAVNPSSAGYLAGMNELQRASEEATMEQMMKTHLNHSEGRADAHRKAMLQISARHDNKLIEIEKRNVMERYVPIVGAGGVVYSFDKKSGKYLDQFGTANGKVKELPWESKRKFFNDSFNQLRDVIKMDEMGQVDPKSEDYQMMLSNARKQYLGAQRMLKGGDWEQFVQEYLAATGTMPPRIGGSGATPGQPADDAAVRAAQEAINF